MRPMRAIITVQDLAKRYRLGKREARYQTFRETLATALSGTIEAMRARLGGAKEQRSSGGEEELWALRDVSFEVQPGEVLGLIGRNGAGKSTLLKILSRITDPTRGRVELYGRVGTLLEVGTGFHPELSGRENIFLSGAILGMRRTEIARKLDEIVDFAGVERFLDVPVKRYSSGMYVRLAFAVAAHLETEILLIDEVLAVGDAVFQKKCLGKMSDVASQGRTILFVSHNMTAIESLCDSCILIEGGKSTARGKPADLVRNYLTAGLETGSGSRSLQSHPGRIRRSNPLMKWVGLSSESALTSAAIPAGGPLSISVSFASERPVCPVLGVVVRTSAGAPIFGVNNRFIAGNNFQRPVSSGTIICALERLSLMPGAYYLDLIFGDGLEDVDWIEQAIVFEIFPSDYYGTGQLPPAGCGPLLADASFRLDETCGNTPIDGLIRQKQQCDLS
jgi:lipopolysaccharide transport system ATP-binding protein